MTWVILSAGLALGASWRRLALLALVVHLPLIGAGLVSFHWWRSRPGQSMRAVRFCEAVSGELRAGSTLRDALERSAVAVDATGLAEACRAGAPMTRLASIVRTEFAEVGPELGAVIARTGVLAVSPAVLFDEVAGLALAQVEVAQEVKVASATARATGFVLVVAPLLGVGWALSRGGLEPYLRHPGQRVAALAGVVLVALGFVVSLLILRSAR